MSVYVDDAAIPATVPNGARTVQDVWCHMTADSRAELDAMADRIGLRREWIQCPGTWKEHYDLTRRRRRAAVRAGAIEVQAREHVQWLASGPSGARGARPESDQQPACSTWRNRPMAADVGSCEWGAPHPDPALCLVDTGLPCGHALVVAAPTCAAHLSGLVATGGRAAVARPCPECGVVAAAMVTDTRDLPGRDS